MTRYIEISDTGDPSEVLSRVSIDGAEREYKGRNYWIDPSHTLRIVEGE